VHIYTHVHITKFVIYKSSYKQALRIHISVFDLASANGLEMVSIGRMTKTSSQ